MTEDDVIIRTRQRMGLPASAGPRILTLIPAALEKAARAAANDVTKRDLLVTDKTSVTASVTSTNQDYYADLASIVSTNGVMLDYLEYGTIYYAPAAGTFTASAKSDFVTKTSHGFPTGFKVRLTTTGTLPDPLALAQDYYTIAVNADNLYLASSRANAFAGTLIDITDTGTGTHTITPWEQSVVQISNKEFGDLSSAVPVSYVFAWLVGSKLFTSAQAGVFSFAVPFIPTIATLPAKLDHDFIDAMVELYQLQAEIGGDSK